jgi:hypothetical protein
MNYDIKVLDKEDLGGDWISFKLKIKFFFPIKNDIVFFIQNAKNPEHNFFNDKSSTDCEGAGAVYKSLVDKLIQYSSRNSTIDILKYQIKEAISKWELENKLTDKGKELGDLYNNL